MASTKQPMERVRSKPAIVIHAISSLLRAVLTRLIRLIRRDLPSSTSTPNTPIFPALIVIPAEFRNSLVLCNWYGLPIFEFKVARRQGATKEHVLWTCDRGATQASGRFST